MIDTADTVGMTWRSENPVVRASAEFRFPAGAGATKHGHHLEINQVARWPSTLGIRF